MSEPLSHGGLFPVYLVAAIQYHLAAEQRRKAHKEQPHRVLQKEISSDEDKIGFARVQEGILKRIREKLLAQTQTNDGVCHVLGLFGPWGSGKTHLLNLVEKELVGNAPSTIPTVAFRCINLWQINNRDELWQTTCTTLEQLNNNKQPSSLTSRDYMVFHANEFLGDTSFTLTMQAGVSAWIADHPMPMPTFLLNLLSMLSIPYDNGSDTPLP